MMFKLRPVLIASIFYLFITVLFNYSLVCNGFSLCHPSHPTDGISIEYITETSRQKILHFENPFSFDQKLFYPFYSTYAMADPGIAHVPIYSVFRTFIPSHNALLLVVFINLFLNYFVMYALLRKLKMSFMVSLLGGLIFGAMSFISYRVLNHYTYTPLFLFPLMFLYVYSLFQTNSTKLKIIYSTLVGATGVYVLFNSFYYFISILIAGGMLVIYGILFLRKDFFNIFKKNISYVISSCVTFLIFIIPWIFSVTTLSKLFTKSDMIGFGGAWLLSSDFLNIFLPSQYNPFYNYLFLKLSGTNGLGQKLNLMFLEGYSKNAYAGVILFLSLIGLILLQKKLSKQSRTSVMMYLTMALFFLLLCFGPFLQIFNRWFLEFEGVMVVLPMPFLLLHYLPEMETLRAPSRFVPLYIFFFVLASSYLWNYLYTKLPDKRRYSIIFVVFVIVFIDQMYFIPKPPTEYTSPIPTKLYKQISADSEKSTVLEIPFTVRDGFSYRGNVKAVSPMKGAIVHNKPIIGGYIARVAPEIFSYYDRLPFISYIASTIDVGNTVDGEPVPKEIKPFLGNRNLLINELDFLNIKYIILKNDELYSKTLKPLIVSLGLKKIGADSRYDLYSRALTAKEFTKIDFTKGNVFQAQVGSTDMDAKKLGNQFENFAKIFVNTKKAKEQIQFSASAKKEITLKVYLNSRRIDEMNVSTDKKIYTVDINTVPPGTQMIDFVIDSSSPGSQVTLYTVEIK